MCELLQQQEVAMNDYMHHILDLLCGLNYFSVVHLYIKYLNSFMQKSPALHTFHTDQMADWNIACVKQS